MERRQLLKIALLLWAVAGFSSFKDGPHTLILNYIPPVGDYGGGSRSPMPPLYVEQNDHTLSFYNNCSGAQIILLDYNNEIIYSDYVDDNDIVDISNTIKGNYTLRLYIIDCVYSGDIYLR